MRRHRLQPRARDSERTWKLTLLELGNRGPPTARCDETYFEETTEGIFKPFLKWFFFIRMAVYMAFHDDESWRVARCSLI